MRAVALALLVAACGKGDTKSTTSKEVEGSLSLGGKPLTVTACRAGRGVTTYVELVTAAGKLRFENQHLYWAQKDFGRGDELACDKLERSWGGGLRKDGTAYFRGHLIFVCRGPTGPLTGDVTVDCGRITAEERASLDKNRSDMLAEQAATKRCEEVEKHEAELFGPARKEAVDNAKSAGLEVSPDGIIAQPNGKGTTVRAYPKPVAYASCRDDAWPAAVQDCAIAAADIAAWDACLTPAIHESMRRLQNEP